MIFHPAGDDTGLVWDHHEYESTISTSANLVEDADQDQPREAGGYAQETRNPDSEHQVGFGV